MILTQNSWMRYRSEGNCDLQISVSTFTLVIGLRTRSTLNLDNYFISGKGHFVKQ